MEWSEIKIFAKLVIFKTGQRQRNQVPPKFVGCDIHQNSIVSMIIEKEE